MSDDTPALVFKCCYKKMISNCRGFVKFKNIMEQKPNFVPYGTTLHLEVQISMIFISRILSYWRLLRHLKTIAGKVSNRMS